MSLLACACGSSHSASNPTTPTTPPVVPPAAPPMTLSGQIISTLARSAVPGASIEALGSTVTAGSDGRFTLTAAVAPRTPFAVTVRADGFRTRQTTIDFPRSTDLVIDLTSTAAPFNETFYQQFARGTHEYPGNVYPLFRWTSAPRIYLKTTDETGRSGPPEVIALVTSALAEGVRRFSAGAYEATIDSGSGDRPEQTGWINVELRQAIAEGDYCGLASQIGGNPGRIQLRLERCGCGSVKIPAAVVMHEIGHILGFFHVPEKGAIMFDFDSGDCRPAVLTTSEQTHVGVVYSRPRGNRDPDVDPSGFVLFAPPHALVAGPGPVR